MGVVTVSCCLVLLVVARGQDTMVALADIERLLQQSQAVLVESMSQQQQSMVQNFNRQQQSMVENINRQQRSINILADKVNDLTDRLDKLQGQDSEGNAKKRFVVTGEVDFERAILTLQQQMKVLQQSSGSGVIYTRWGRTTCPGNGTDLVYAGYAAGTNYRSKGGGTNYLCLPTDPTWGYYVNGQQEGADVSGVEYEFGYGYSTSQSSHFYGSSAEDDDVPCAVCRSTRPSSVMIPGRSICYPGWSMEYSGYLVGEASVYDSSEFVCMDGAPEAVPHGAANKNGALFYVAEVTCGSLACPPYVEGRELACVVCTK